MPLPASPRLGMTRPAGTDPFLRTDLLDDFDILDQYPGVFPCTSTSRPSWGAAQAGMLASETDTGRVIRWSGTAWTIVENYGRTYRGSLSMNTDLAAGAQATYTVDTINTYRPCVINYLLLVRVNKAAVSPQYMTIHPWIDGSDAGYGWDTVIGFPDGVSGTTKAYRATAQAYGSRSVSTVGTASHTIACRVNVDNTSSNTITILGVKSMVWLSEA